MNHHNYISFHTHFKYHLCLIKQKQKVLWVLIFFVNCQLISSLGFWSMRTHLPWRRCGWGGIQLFKVTRHTNMSLWQSVSLEEVDCCYMSFDMICYIMCLSNLVMPPNSFFFCHQNYGHDTTHAKSWWTQSCTSTKWVAYNILMHGILMIHISRIKSVLHMWCSLHFLHAAVPYAVSQ